MTSPTRRHFSLKDLKLKELEELLDSEDESLLEDMTKSGLLDPNVLARLKISREKMAEKRFNSTQTSKFKLETANSREGSNFVNNQTLSSSLNAMKTTGLFERLRAKKVFVNPISHSFGENNNNPIPVSTPNSPFLSSQPKTANRTLFRSKSSDSRNVASSSKIDHQEEILNHLQFLCHETVRHNRVMEQKVDGIRNMLSLIVREL